MCGIAGFIDYWNPKANDSFERGRLLKEMCDVIRHRGPDDDGFLLKHGVALGIRRLSIIDLAGGTQPISGEDGSVTIVFNGEIYNFPERLEQMEAHGRSIKTTPYTEVIGHAYEE